MYSINLSNGGFPQNVSVVRVEWHGSEALTLVYRGPHGRAAEEISCPHDEPRPEIVHVGHPRSFDGDGALFHQHQVHTCVSTGANRIGYNLSELLAKASGPELIP